MCCVKEKFVVVLKRVIGGKESIEVVDYDEFRYYDGSTKTVVFYRLLDRENVVEITIAKPGLENLTYKSS